jgi:hypothetical protein
MSSIGPSSVSSRSNDGGHRKSRGWGLLSRVAHASKRFKRPTAAHTTEKGAFYEPLVDGGGVGSGGKGSEGGSDNFGVYSSGQGGYGAGEVQSDRPHTNPQEGLPQPQGGHKEGQQGAGNSAARQSAAAAWENLQLMSGLSLDDTVTVVRTPPIRIT